MINETFTVQKFKKERKIKIRSYPVNRIIKASSRVTNTSAEVLISDADFFTLQAFECEDTLLFLVFVIRIVEDIHYGEKGKAQITFPLSIILYQEGWKKVAESKIKLTLKGHI